MRNLPSIPLKLACVYLVLVTSACSAPPSGPRIVLHPVRAVPSRSHLQKLEPCRTTVPARLTDTQKTNLFQEFDVWQQDRRPAGVPVETPVPPPGALPNATAASNKAC